MIKYYFFVKVKKKEVDIGDYNGFTFEFELFEPKSLVKSRLKEIARVILVLKRAAVDGRCDNHCSIRKKLL